MHITFLSNFLVLLLQLHIFLIIQGPLAQMELGLSF